MTDLIRKQAADATRELIKLAKLKSGQILVVGCSSSEVGGLKIGTSSSIEIADAIYEGISEVLSPAGIFLAAQCCEHLNRSLVMERAGVKNDELIVNAIPTREAGGSFATSSYQKMTDPVLVSAVRADAGLDIGSTLIGMHLKNVVVPVRLSVNHIGEAYLVAARVRPPYTGGPRATYDDSLF